MIERRVTLGLVFAILMQTGGALVWAGAAAHRLSALEAQAEFARPMSERLVRVETELAGVRAQLDRIEARISEEAARD